MVRRLPAGTTRLTVWWTNPVVVNNSADTLNVTDSTIYLVTSDPGAFWLVQADKLTLVVQPGVALTASSGAAVVIGNIADYLWIEGGIDATGRVNGVILAAVRFSVLNNLTVNNAGPLYGVSLENASRNRLESVVASNNGFIGVNLDSASSFNTLSNVTASNNSQHGITLDNASNNRLSGVTASDNRFDGIRLDNAAFNTLSGLTVNNNVAGVHILNSSSNNTLSVVKASNNIFGINLVDASANTLTEVTASNNSTSGISLTRSSNNRLLVAAASNNSIGVDLFAAVNNTLAGLTVNSNNSGVNVRSVSDGNTVTAVTASNNSGQGIELDTSSNNSLLGVAASNNRAGVQLSQADNNTLSDLAASNNDEGINLFSASNNTFTGWLEVGTNSTYNCFARFLIDAGLVDSTCEPNGTSDHTLVTGIDLTSAFAGKVLIDDVQNADDDNGAELVFPADPAAFDWTSFDNGFRGWGVDGPAFPSANQRGRWSIGGGRIWDWSISIGDNGNAGNPALLNVLTLPTGSETLTHTWSDTSTTQFLRKAVEMPGDGIGNDNTLCESSETCIYLPNIGSYQGHGDFVSAGPFVDGVLTGIRLMRYQNNGR
jgi:parallel beta-helix repeat protein